MLSLLTLMVNLKVVNDKHRSDSNTFLTREQKFLALSGEVWTRFRKCLYKNNAAMKNQSLRISRFTCCSA